ncbi:MAG: alpha/beta fold hydrolase [Patescibacteria group bacterium]|nr:alpha/beta fold hydrolase [Patescibacteria group bacterium]
MAEKINLKTYDDVRLVGDWQSAPTILGAMVLLHMMPETRLSWLSVQRACVKLSLASLAIDMRGHGDSVETSDGGKIDYRNFSSEEHQSTYGDVVSAVDWVRGRGIDRRRIILGGASYGANLALQFLASDPMLPGAVLLSPSLNYHGIETEDHVRNLTYNQSLFIASSLEDKQSYDDSKKLFDMAACENKIFVPYKGAGHGTSMFAYDRELPEKIVAWAEALLHD